LPAYARSILSEFGSGVVSAFQDAGRLEAAFVYFHIDIIGISVAFQADDGGNGSALRARLVVLQAADNPLMRLGFERSGFAAIALIGLGNI